MVRVYLAGLPKRDSGYSHSYQSEQAHRLLDMALKREYPGLAAPFLLEKDSGGKPFLKDYPEIHISLSHSGSFLACAIAEKPVGIDVEMWKIARKRDKIAERFHPQERALYEGAGEQERLALFYSLWVLKESFVKAVGTGLRLPLNAFCMLPEEREVRHLILGKRYFYRLCEGKLTDASLAVCSEEEDFAAEPIWLELP